MQLSRIYYGTISVITNIDACNLSNTTKFIYDKKSYTEREIIRKRFDLQGKVW